MNYNNNNDTTTSTTTNNNDNDNSAREKLTCITIWNLKKKKNVLLPLN